MENVMGETMWDPGNGPVRKPTNHGRKVIGKFPSAKMSRPIWWESQLERDYIYLLETDPDVVAFHEQPFQIRYTIDNTVHTYTPDFLVKRRSGRKQIVEVKPEEVALSEEYGRFSRIVTLICKKHGCEFITVTEKTIRVQPRLDNVKFLSRYSRVPVHPNHLIEQRRVFIKSKKPSLSMLVKKFSNRGIGQHVVYALIARGEVTVDLDAPIMPSSIVSSPHRNDSAA